MCVLSAKQIYDLKSTDVYAGEVVSILYRHLSTLDHNQFGKNKGVEATFQAIKNGIPEIATELAKANPNILWSSTDPEDSRNMFAYAVLHRQEKVARFLYAREKNAHFTTDEDGNNTLHLAAKLAPHFQLDHIAGAALQLQSELRWFKSVEAIVPRHFNENKNKDDETPSQVFAREHKNLLKEAEEWIKKTAESSTVVGALIITIMFAAAFTLPGGNDQNTGFPIFLNRTAPVNSLTVTPFRVFIVADAISLFTASSSVLMFLGILTSRYAYEDFLISLPMKLIVGISSLFISIATLTVAFCAALYVTLQCRLREVIPVTVLAVIPIMCFLLLQSPLLVEIISLTFRRDIFKKNL
ncbi:hypothetical protein SLEP1_g43159 [Rubroshorea leprosula]|uniref:PGG domain-containing protein n=1 Tax=Rubroshorea leprosula TaxID=152421 RepID=A0AAV5LC39_9ROSI|nr:hypothetical protein SLEP1_g43159 [Rubroshorea leprosula]